MKETAIEDSLPGIVWKTQSPGGVDIFQFVLLDNLKIKIVNSCTEKSRVHVVLIYFTVLCLIL